MGAVGLGNGDQVRLFWPDGTSILDMYTYSAHAVDTTTASGYSRCPTGESDGTFSERPLTKGAANNCPPPDGGT